MKRSLSAVAKFTVTPLVIAAALTLPVPAAYAIPITFVANLTGANEVPLVASPGTGFAAVYWIRRPKRYRLTRLLAA